MPPVAHLRFALFVALVLICFLGGGGSRGDIASLLYVRPAAILIAAAMILLPGPIDWRAIRTPLLLLGLFALLIAVQLVPLPPGIWMSLPGRAPLVEAAAAAGFAQPWRPLSIAPDLTLNSLAALTVPAAALVGFAALEAEHRRLLLPVVILAALASALIGLAQLTGGAESPFYFYRITNEGSPVGLMSNRNHQAFLLAAAYPMLGAWASASSQDRRGRQFRATAVVALGIFLVPLILMTGSRAGLLLTAFGAVMGLILYLQGRRLFDGRGRRGLQLGLALLAGGLLIVTFAAVALSRAQALERLLVVDIESDSRLANLPVFVRMAGDFFPFGAGTGTFDPLFRIYEPLEALSPNYLNQAHNDLADVAITGGVPVLLLLLVLLAWWATRATRAFFGSGRDAPGSALARLGAVVMFIFLAASLIDYPLRTPSLALVFAICCGWLSGGGRGVRLAREEFPGGGARGFTSN